jgi:UDP-2,4-diacetamido-2,4,6-trideoxy-beta-L-altropyranose hydrolase
MRSLALANVFVKNGWSVGFASTAETFSSVAALRDSPIQRLTLDQTRESEPQAMAACWPQGADILVVDHYQRDVVFESACRPWAQRIVVIDDMADRRHDADSLIDVANEPGAYAGLVPSQCRVLTGPQYAIIGSAFRTARVRALARRGGAVVERVLINFGQIDAINATRMAILALRNIGFKGEINVVLARAALHLADVCSMADAQTKIHIDPSNMAMFMTDADFAIGAGGVSSLERCCLGLPSIIVTVADNQRRIATMLKDGGASIDAGEMNEGTSDRLEALIDDALNDVNARTRVAKSAASLVDGYGVDRIFEMVH